MQQARTWQTSIGVQRQFFDTMSVDVDYIYTQGRFEKDTIDNVNLTYDEATGVNIPYTNRAALPYPQYGIISMIPHNPGPGITACRRRSPSACGNARRPRLRIRYRRSRTRRPAVERARDRIVHLAPDLGNEYTLADTDQRHRAVLSAI